jgi:hypothetical protein
MRMKVEQVPNALLALRWGVMVLALIALFVLEWSGVQGNRLNVIE